MHFSKFSTFVTFPDIQSRLGIGWSVLMKQMSWWWSWWYKMTGWLWLGMMVTGGWVFPWWGIRLWLVPKLLKKVDLAKYEIGLSAWECGHTASVTKVSGERCNYNINILLRHSSQTLSGASCAQRSPPILIRKLRLPPRFKLPRWPSWRLSRCRLITSYY